jgi:hypothetical protein
MAINKILLRKMIHAHFNKKELAILCDDSRINIEDVPGNDDGLENLVFEIIKHAERRMILAELVKNCKRHRPFAAYKDGDKEVHWDQVYEAQLDESVRSNSKMRNDFQSLGLGEQYDDLVFRRNGFDANALRLIGAADEFWLADEVKTNIATTPYTYPRELFPMRGAVLDKLDVIRNNDSTTQQALFY